MRNGIRSTSHKKREENWPGLGDLRSAVSAGSETRAELRRGQRPAPNGPAPNCGGVRDPRRTDPRRTAAGSETRAERTRAERTRAERTRAERTRAEPWWH